MRNLAIEYTALSLAVPEKVHFRFKLEGQDTDWREVVNNRHVEYSNLAPKHYPYCDEFGKTRGIPVSCDADGDVKELSPGAALCLYRIAQEGLGNVAKHAQAKRVQVRLTRSNGHVRLTVTDDGVGCSPDHSGEAGGLGLINMRERVRQLKGTFEFESAPGRGTTITAEVPFRPAS